MTDGERDTSRQRKKGQTNSLLKPLSKLPPGADNAMMAA